MTKKHRGSIRCRLCGRPLVVTEELLLMMQRYKHPVCPRCINQQTDRTKRGK